MPLSQVNKTKMGDKIPFVKINMQGMAWLCNFWGGMIDSSESCSALPSTSCPSICQKLYNKGAWALSYKSRWFLSPKLSWILGWNNNNILCKKNNWAYMYYTLAWVENYRDNLTDFLSVEITFFLPPSCFHMVSGIPEDSVFNSSRQIPYLPLIPEAQQLHYFKHLEGKNRCCHFSSAHFFFFFRVINN